MNNPQGANKPPPKDTQIDLPEVEGGQCGEKALLRPAPTTLPDAFDLLATLPDDFMAEERFDPPGQERNRPQ